ncbi:prepilin-type N-terminal cleavage/methylation domain-containing protein [Proteiniclasticum aestuarii]|uniref:prepilin-type N-terminal cleavage/methylation domain-containing protein n=1 Tax=Proteiniclasticum aestuarii TaxID=2817862 RepID=UPI001F60383D|nr:prepilin-type N-terminal cleavage/methylation domain-containing protein [Proteiniclasticum aestuarii]
MIKLRKKQKGFTLVELLIVIAIIAVLAAVVTPVALSAINDSKATAVYAEIKSIETAYLTAQISEDSTEFEDLELNGVETNGNSKNAEYSITTSDGKVSLGVNVASAKVVTGVEKLLADAPSSVFDEIIITNN